MLLLGSAVRDAGSPPAKLKRANVKVTEGPSSSAWGCGCCCCGGTGGMVELGMWERKSGAELEFGCSDCCKLDCRLTVDDSGLLVDACRFAIDDCRSPVDGCRPPPTSRSAAKIAPTVKLALKVGACKDRSSLQDKCLFIIKHARPGPCHWLTCSSGVEDSSIKISIAASTGPNVRQTHSRTPDCHVCSYRVETNTQELSLSLQLFHI